jgi:hypothetical protein
MRIVSAWNSVATRALLLALVLVTVDAAHAKAPATRAAIENTPRAITPKPKEWAMDDDPITPPPPRPATPPGAPGQPPAQAAVPTPGPSAANVERATGGASVESVPVAAAHAQRQLPYFWLMVTALMSFGALAMCASFILRDDTPPVAEDVPVVPDALEVKS